MSQSKAPPRSARNLIDGGILITAVVLAIALARPYAGSWNDASRLATVECLVDHQTLAIDDSLFLQVPHPDDMASPYPSSEPLLRQKGTADKLLIQGRFYSDKSPVPALLLACVYQFLQWLTGLTARDAPALFCYLMTVASSGLAYIVTVRGVHHMGGILGLPSASRLTLTASLGLATVALPYAEHVNNHILLLGVSTLLMLSLIRLNQERDAGRRLWRWVAAVGTLAGLGYTIDLGAGPVILLCSAAWLACRCRQWRPIALFGLTALPWLTLHHSLNYAVGGTFGPANAVAEYFQWPGCPFNAQNMTGSWKHHGIGSFLLYAGGLLAGKRGFLGHNLPLFLLVPGLWRLLGRRSPERPEILFAVCCWGGVWLMYAINSNNSSGQCLTIRWFVPLLAPSYFLLALLLRDRPSCLVDFAILSGWGILLILLGSWNGPWIKHMIPLFWPVQAAALASWAGYRFWQERQRRLHRSTAPGHVQSRAA